MIVVGVDIGGTFTDLMLYDTERGAAHVHKLHSTPAEPERAMVDGLVALCQERGIDPSQIDTVYHGTTVATNALLTFQGAPAGMITNEGFRDIVHIGRHQRPQHYSIMQDIPWQARPFVRRRHRKVVAGRLAPPVGAEVTPLDEDEVRAAAQELLDDGVTAVAVCFLFSYLNPEHERRAAEIVAEVMPDAFVTASADVFPQFREFERFTTASMNAFVGPLTGNYLDRLASSLAGIGVTGDLHVMMSNGGLASATQASRRPVTLMLSGPAAGVLGGLWAGGLDGRERLITFDVGGTSADIGLVTERGVVEAQARDTQVAGYPLLVPMVDIHTIGAGGGSIAYRDHGGAFRVGPRSAGATPGPACYGRGGEEPTLTDANLVLGRIDADRFLGGEMALDKEAAERAIAGLAAELGLEPREAAEGAVTIANASMAAAIRSRTIQKGHDPRDFSLVAFGGAGPLHAADVADLLGTTEVLVPPHPGITAATGLLTSDLKYDQMRTVFMREGAIDAGAIDKSLDDVADELRSRLRDDGVSEADITISAALDCRYMGQGYELRVPLPEGRFTDADLAEFHNLHRQEYGHAFTDPIEVVNLRVTGVGAREGVDRLPASIGSLDESRLGTGDGLFRVGGKLESLTTIYLDRGSLPPGEPFPGPAVVFQRDTTVVVPPGWTGCAQPSGNLILSR